MYQYQSFSGLLLNFVSVYHPLVDVPQFQALGTENHSCETMTHLFIHVSIYFYIYFQLLLSNNADDIEQCVSSVYLWTLGSGSQCLTHSSGAMYLRCIDGSLCQLPSKPQSINFFIVTEYSTIFCLHLSFALYLESINALSIFNALHAFLLDFFSLLKNKSFMVRIYDICQLDFVDRLKALLQTAQMY